MTHQRGAMKVSMGGIGQGIINTLANVTDGQWQALATLAGAIVAAGVAGLVASKVGERQYDIMRQQKEIQERQVEIQVSLVEIEQTKIRLELVERRAEFIDHVIAVAVRSSFTKFDFNDFKQRIEMVHNLYHRRIYLFRDADQYFDNFLPDYLLWCIDNHQEVISGGFSKVKWDNYVKDLRVKSDEIIEHTKTYLVPQTQV